MKNLFYFTMALASFSANAQTPFITSAQIDINNLNARQLVHGDMWWDPSKAEPGCEYPKGSGKHAMFGGGFWMSGIDASMQIYVSSQTFRQTGHDYWPGPLDANASLTYAVSKDWARIWKIDKATIDQFKNITQHTPGNTPPEILEWPAKNNTHAKGANNAILTITTDMAPFVDVDKDGSYDPLKGDYPSIKGDQMLWYVFSDNGPTHDHSGASQSMQMDIKACVYGYKQNSLIDNVIYYEYYVTNKSGLDYQGFRAGIFADVELGYHIDDYIGFDSTRRLGYVYNAASSDGTGAPEHYGANIPMAGVMIIKAPNDEPDNPAPAGSFLRHGIDNMPSPVYTVAIVNGLMRSTLADGTPLKNPLTNTIAQHQFPANPGVPGQWSECSLNNTPGDRKFVIASNDYTFAKGSTAVYTFALVASPPLANNGCPSMNITPLLEVADTARRQYTDPVGVQPLAAHKVALKLYPNPATNALYVDKQIKEGELAIYDATGRKQTAAISNKGNQTVVDIAHLSPGLYHIVYMDADATATSTFVKE